MNLPATLLLVGFLISCHGGFLIAVCYLAVKKKLTSHRFASIFTIYLFISVFGPLLSAIGVFSPASLNASLIGFLSGVALLHFVTAYPIGYFGYKYLLCNVLESLAQRLSERSQAGLQDIDQ